MRKNNTQTIGAVLREVLRQEGLETPLNQHRLVDAWPEVMGRQISKYTGNIFIQNQTLHVQIRSSVLRQELAMGRAQLVRRLNEHVGAQVITDIRFY